MSNSHANDVVFNLDVVSSVYVEPTVQKHCPSRHLRSAEIDVLQGEMRGDENPIGARPRV
jgi:hypothetical protein